MAETTEQYKARIAQIKNSIENEPHIKKMRDDIAEGISKTGNRQANIENQFQAVIEETTDKDVISAPEIIAARVDYEGEKHNNLKDRLDKEQRETASQFYTYEQIIELLKIKKADMTYVDTVVANILDGGPSIFAQTLNGLRAEYPNGASGVALVYETDPAHIYVWNGSDWVDYGAYAGPEPKDRTITPIKTTFAKGGGNRNLFEGKFIEASLTISGVTYTYQNTANAVAAIIPIEPLEAYTTFKSSGETNQFTFAYFDKYPSAGSVALFGFSSSQPSISSYVAPANAKYLMVYLSNAAQGKKPSKFQVEKSPYFTRYVSPSDEIVIDLHKSSIPKVEPDMVDFSTKLGVNLFEGNYYDMTMSVDTPKVIAGAKSAIVPIDAYQRYTVTKSDDTNDLRIGLFSSFPAEGATASKYYKATGEKFKTVASDAGHKFMMVVVTTTAENKTPAKLQIEKGNLPHKFAPSHVLNEEKMGIRQKVHQTSFSHLILTNDHYHNSAETFLLSSILGDVEKLYAKYDALMALFPDYITKILLATEPTGLPIYLYRFKPPVRMSWTTEYNVEPPKILYSGCIHGHEQSATISGYLFFEDLAKNWKESDILSALRWNVHFMVIPVLNPWGFNNGNRKNSNSVDLARNFTLGFTGNGTVDDPYYGGASALSEVESKAVDKVLTDNPDIAFAIDHHNFNYYIAGENKFLTWFDSLDENVLKLLVGTAKQLNAKVKRDYPHVDQGNENLVSIERQVVSGMLEQQFAYRGIPGTIIEYVKGLDSTEADLHKFGAEVVGNLIWNAVQNIDFIQESDLAFGY